MKTLVLLLAVGAIIALSGCTWVPGGVEEGSLEVLVSDQPADIGDFSYLNVKLSEIRVFSLGSGYETFPPAVDSFDLTKLEGDNALSLVNATLDEGRYTKIEFHVLSVEGETSEGAADIQVPSNKLMITKNFDVEPNKTVAFVFDINVVKRGQTNSYNLMPVIGESGIVGKDVAEAKVRRVSREHAKRHEPAGPGGTGQARMTVQEARAIAQGTECTEKGSLLDEHSYNENSRTWWIELEMKPEYANELCNPACVVTEEDEMVEINWRCTGVLPPGGDDGVCTGQGGATATGQFSLFVSDAPADIGDFSELIVSLSKAMIHKSADGGNGGGNESGGEWLEFGLNVSIFDLTELVDGNVLEVLGISLPAGMYTQVRLEAESATGLVGNETVTIDVPSGTLKIIKPFMIGAGQEVEFLFDINVVRKGNGQGTREYNLLPVIGKSGVWDSQNQNPAVCGNDLCEVGENNETCPGDCLEPPPANGTTNETNQTESVCGDLVIDEGEDCDDTELDDKECNDFGYSGGGLSCALDCTFDFSGCVNETNTTVCGNDECEEGEDHTNCPADCEAPPPAVIPCDTDTNCTSYCGDGDEESMLFTNGTCTDSLCAFINTTCEFGCADAACLINQPV